MRSDLRLWVVLLGLALLPSTASAELLEYGGDCQTALIEGNAAVPTADLETDPLSLPLDLCARGTADVEMVDGSVRMSDVEIGFFADPGQSLILDLFERDEKGEPPSLSAVLLLLDFAFLLQQTDESLGSPSGSQFDADFTADGKIDFEFTGGKLAGKSGPIIDAFLIKNYGEPLLPMTEFREPVTVFIETTDDPEPSLLVDLLYIGPFNLLGLFTADFVIRAPFQFVLEPLGPAPPPPPECDPAPRLDCLLAGSAKLSISEKKAGKEKLALQLKKLIDPLSQAQLGNPVAGATRYDVCLYDSAGTLAGGVGLDQGSALCGKKDKPCWKDLSGRGFKYKDGEASAGVKKLTAKAGEAGKGKITLSGGNKASKGQSGLPTGITTALIGATQVSAQLIVDGGTCFGATLTQVQKADAGSFKAKGP